MTISLVGTATGTTTCTVPTHNIGDLIVIFAYRSGSTTAPTLGATYKSILTQAGTSCACRIGFKIATTTSDASGTWTNAVALVCHVYTSNGYGTGHSLAIGGSASVTNAASLTVNYPALTMTNANNSSWAAGFIGTSNTSQTIATAPTGMTNESHETAAANQAAGHDTEGTVSSWSSTNVVTTGTAGDSVSCTIEICENIPAVASIGNIIQHVSFSYDGIVSVNEPGNNFAFPLPNPTLAGNGLVMAVAYPSGTAPNAITDNASNTWSTTAVITSDPGAGNTALNVYVLATANTGTQLITVAFASTVQPCKVWITELYNITATVNGTVQNTSQNTASNGQVSPGSFTPTNNNANGGNLILSYMCNTNNSGTTNPFRINAAYNYTLNDADIGWNTGTGMPNASQFLLQATSAATVPLFNLANGGTADTYNVAAVALSVGTQGTAMPTGIRILRACHFSSNSNVTSQPFQIPAAGNLGFTASFASAVAPPTITSASDSNGNTWTKESAASGEPTFLYFGNSGQNPGRVLTVVFGTGSNNLQLVYFDITGAATAPFDQVTGNSASANSVTTIANQPNLTPSGTNQLIIAFLQNGLGPTTACTSPGGVIFDLPQYTGQTDSSNMNWGNGLAHLYNGSNTSAENWTWTIASQTSNSVTSTAIAFKAAPTGGVAFAWFALTSEPQPPDTWLNVMT